MTYPTLPSVIPAGALRQPWGVTPIDPLRRTQLDDGAVALERKFSRLPGLYTIVFELSGPEFDIMMNFWQCDLNAGQSWFLCPIAEGMRERVQLVRMGPSPWQGGSPANGVYHFSWQAEVRELPTLTQAERIAVDAWLQCERDVDELIIELNTLFPDIEEVPYWP